jgi:hypothetical protein
MRFLCVVALIVSALTPSVRALAETTPRPAPPKIGETQDADKKAEYLESKHYMPCPSDVRFPNGQQACLGLPGYPDDPNE